MAQRKRAAARAAPAWLDPVPVKEWMTELAVTIRADVPVPEAFELMKTRKIRHLPVVGEGGRLVGIVTERDVLRAFESLIRERVRGVQPLAESPSGGELYDYGFTQALREEPWRNEGPGH